MSIQRILVVGGGGREHAMLRALATATPRPTLFIAPGNGGTGGLATNVPIRADDVAALVAFAEREKIDLVIPGPEISLVNGLADHLALAKIPCCGPVQGAAQLEGSKAFMREVAFSVNAPSPRFVTSRREAELGWAIDAWDGLPVVKADGLASGKGVFLPDTKQECMTVVRDLLRGSLGDAGREVVLEERLTGVEASLFFACAGNLAVRLPHARDHKRIFENERGPNTGGMGAVSPNPAMSEALEDEVQERMVQPVLQELIRRGTPFYGFLFVGLMLTESGPRLLEFNVRLGDPEAEAILPRLAPGDFLELCMRVAQGRLRGFTPRIDPVHTCAVILAAANYPDTPRSGDGIHIVAGFETADRWLDHAGTTHKNGKLVTSGGRVAAVVARGNDAEEARKSAYEGVMHVSFDGMQFRKDIGK